MSEEIFFIFSLLAISNLLMAKNLNPKRDALPLMWPVKSIEQGWKVFFPIF